MKREPESARDMRWAQEQAAGTVKVVYEDAKNTPEEGALHSTEVSVRPSRYDDFIEVRKENCYYGHRDEGRWGWPIHPETEWSRKMPFEEFRSSEWWEPYLERTRRLNFDSSWMDSFKVDAEEDFAAVTFDVPEYKSVWWCSSDVPTGETVRCEVDVSSDGTVLMRFDGESEESTVSEFIEAVRRLRAFEEAGVSLDDEGNVIVRKTSERGE